MLDWPLPNKILAALLIERWLQFKEICAYLEYEVTTEFQNKKLKK